MNPRPQGEQGFTLMELMISLGLFALIAVAGLALVQGIINVQGRTEVRLDRLAELQRTMFVVTSDVDQIAGGRITGNPREGLKFVRSAPGLGGAKVQIEYLVAGGMLIRKGGPAIQRLLPGVTAARWRFWNGEWRDRWPLSEETADLWPRAIEMELQIVSPNGGPAGRIRRVIVLPHQLPPEPGMLPMKRPDPGEQGMILVNVLMMVAIAAGLVLLMINREQLALDRGLRTREAARAQAAVRGGELSAIVELRRDGKVSPGQDYPGEPWGSLSESGAPIEGGTFDLAISDAEGRFNINSVRSGEAASLILFQTIARTVGLSDQEMDMCVQMIRLMGPVTDLRPIRALGLDEEVVARLERLVTALPGNTTVNLNAADEEMLALLFRDAFVAQRLVALRARRGYLTPQDLIDARLTIPWGTSFRSTTFWVRTRATIGRTSQQTATLLKRSWNERGEAEVVPIERWRNAAVPPEAPQFAPPR